MHRSEAHIAKRVKELSLHLQVSFSEDEGSDDELAVLPAKKPVTAGSTRAVAGSDNFGGIIFSDQDGDSDGGLDLDPEAPLSPLAPVLPNRRGAAHATQAAGDTQIDTQYDETQYTAHTAQSPASPLARPRTRPQAQTGSGSGTQASDFAGLFSPSDTSLNEDIEQEARPKNSAAAGTQLQGTFTDQATQSQNPFATQSQQPTTQRSQPTVRKAKLREAPVATNLPVGRAAWDLDEHDTDILEQRALGLMRSTGGASYGLSDGDDDEDGVTATAAHRSKPAKRGLKRPKPSARVGKAADSDGEDDLFAEETQSQHIEAVAAPAQEKAAVTQNKRRAVIESDDE
jgi:hypothetical protein